MEHLLSGLPIKLPARSPSGHKGDFGHVLSICGSERYQGAAVLAALGAVHSGAGMVTAAFPRAAYAPIAAKLTVTPLLPLPNNRQGTLRVSAIQELRAALPGKSAVLLGCGLGMNADTIALTELLLQEVEAPLVLDADALNAIARIHSVNSEKSLAPVLSQETPYLPLCGINSGGAHMDGADILNSRACACPVLTPHMGEMSRLCGVPVDELLQNPVEFARGFAKKYDVILVLKGAQTVVAGAGENEAWVCPLSPNSGLAKAGSGDLLAGMIASLLAQGMKPYGAAVGGVYLHALAAAHAAERLSQSGMTATDCVEELKRIAVDGG